MHAAKAGDLAPRVSAVASATASVNGQTLIGFSLKSETGPINFSMSMELLGDLVSHALRNAQDHAKELRRNTIAGGAIRALELIPEAMAVSHGEVSGIEATRLVITMGDLSLAFVVDAELFSQAAQSLRAPATSLRGPAKIIFPTAKTQEITLPRHLTIRAPTSSSHLPVNWAHLIGFITVLWGDFEMKFDEVIQSLNAKSREPIADTDWRIGKFARRRKLFLRLWREHAEKFPNLLRYIEMLCDDASSLHAVRNLLVHGRLHSEMDQGQFVVRAQGTYKNELVTAQFGLDELTTLYYDVSHLCGRLDFLIDPDDSSRKPQPFSSQDKRKLRALLAKVRQNTPSPSTRKARTQSSRQ